MIQRIIAIDYGRRHIGLAISDPLASFALPLETLRVPNAKADKIQLLLDHLAATQNITQFVVGDPLHMSGQPSEMSQEIRQFAKDLEARSHLPVALIDERLTSSQSETLLKEQNYSRKKRAKLVHNTSAMILLQNYLDLNKGAISIPSID